MSIVQDPPLRLLVVEDDPMIVRLIRIYLKDLGHPYTLQTAETAEAALELWQEQGYDLVISDLNLGLISGLDLFSQLRSRDAQVPLILTTGLDSPEVRQRAKGLHLSGYFVKPFPMGELVTAARQALQTRAS